MDFIEFIKTVLLSVIFILLIHTIFIYFKDNFTEKKTYDYINNPDEKYKDIYNKINSEEKEEITRRRVLSQSLPRSLKRETRSHQRKGKEKA